MKNFFIAASVAVVLISLGVRAQAAPEISCAVDPRSVDPAKDQPAQITCTVISGQAPPAAEKIFLVETDMPAKKGETAMPALDLKTFVQGDEAVGIAIVFETHHLWLGNSEWWQGREASKTEGYYKPLIAAIETLNTAGPPGSKYALIAYGFGATVKAQGDLKDLTGDKIGTQRELSQASVKAMQTETNPEGLSPVVGLDVAAGLDEAIPLLNKMGVERKVLIIIGDGLRGETLADYKKKVQADGIEVFAVGIQSLLADAMDFKGDSTGWKKIASTNAVWKENPEGLASAVKGIGEGLSDRYYLRFAGADLKLMKSFQWDEQPHTFALRGVEKKDVDLAEDIPMSPKWISPPDRKKPKKSSWPLILGIVGGVLLLGIVAVLLLKRKKPAPEPVVVAAPVIAAPEPVKPAPAGPMKTVMIGIGGDDQGFPIVGWVVPLNGPNQFQTFKLQPGATKIGTGGASHVVINDGFMSTEHAQIVMSPAGFVLVDGGSTNGTLVNEKRVDKHELVDNDVFLMGKTQFRFKSIN